MIVLRRDNEHRWIRRGRASIRLCFDPRDLPEPMAEGFAALEAFHEIRLPPDGASAPYPRGEAQIVTYVYQGTLAQEESTGRSGVIHPGEFQAMTTSRNLRRKEANASRTERARLFRICLRPAEAGLGPACEQRRFTAAQRRNVPFVVASPDGRTGSLRVRQDAIVCSSLLDPGHHLVCELEPGRSAWLHVLRGTAELDGYFLSEGDGAGVAMEPSLSLTGQESAEILLVHLGSASPSREGAPLE